MDKKQKWDLDKLTPTDDSIRVHHDTYNEDTRYKHKEKRRRKKEKDRLKEITRLEKEDMEDL